MKLTKEQQKRADEIIKRACERGDVLPVEEAFKKYPAEEEWHEGKIENILAAYNITKEELDEIREGGYYLSEGKGN